jgi:hypothetical protein
MLQLLPTQRVSHHQPWRSRLMLLARALESVQILERIVTSCLAPRKGWLARIVVIGMGGSIRE